MIFTEERLEGSNATGYIAEYYRYKIGGEKNPKWNTFCGLILDLKEKKASGLLYFFRRVNPLIAKDVVICTVPSSDPENTQTGIRLLALQLCSAGRLDGTACLVRTRKLEKASRGGPRSVDLHLETIQVSHEHIIRGAEVLLLDDVTTTGASIKACEQLLLAAGAGVVKTFALARTGHS